MNLLRSLITAVLLSVAFMQTAAADIFRAALSPSGRHLALETEAGGKRVVAVFDNDNASFAPKTFDASTQTVTRLVWADEAFLLLLTSQKGPGRLEAGRRDAARGIQFGNRSAGARLEDMEFRSAYSLDTRTMRAVQLLADTPGISLTRFLDEVVSLGPGEGRIVMQAPIWLDDPSLGSTTTSSRHPFYNGVIQGDTVVGKRGSRALWSVELSTGKGTRIATPNLRTRSWIVDANGAAVASLEYANDRYTLARRGGSGVELALPDSDSVSALGLSGDGRTIDIMVSDKAEARTLRRIELETGAVKPFEAALLPDAIVRDPATGAVVGGRNASGAALWLDPQRTRVQGDLERGFPGSRVEIVSASTSARRYVFHADVGAERKWFYYDDAARSADPLGVSKAPQ